MQALSQTCAASGGGASAHCEVESGYVEIFGQKPVAAALDPVEMPWLELTLAPEAEGVSSVSMSRLEQVLAARYPAGAANSPIQAFRRERPQAVLAPYSDRAEGERLARMLRQPNSPEAVLHRTLLVRFEDVPTRDRALRLLGEESGIRRCRPGKRIPPAYRWSARKTSWRLLAAT